MDKEALMAAAMAARENAYIPYSDFAVGAAVLGEDGKVYTGCNIENAAYSVTCCAERVALFKAVSEGVRRIEAVAVCGAPAGQEGKMPACTPCGVCRQALFEFGGGAMPVVLNDGQGGLFTMTLGDLLPMAFGPEDL